jgi:hypothetical protein
VEHDALGEHDRPCSHETEESNESRGEERATSAGGPPRAVLGHLFPSISTLALHDVDRYCCEKPRYMDGAGIYIYSTYKMEARGEERMD